VRPTTAYRYAWIVHHYIIPTIGVIALRDLRSDHLDHLYAQLLTAGGRDRNGLAPMTVHETHVIVRSAVDLAVQRHLVDHNVAHGAQPPRPRALDRSGPQSWTAAQLRQFLRSARDQRLYPALHLAAHTGMRRGEIDGLKWSDLNVRAARLSISRTLQNVGGRPTEFGVKTRTSRRCVDLDTHTLSVLASWRRRLCAEHLPARVEDWMFYNRKGHFLNPESISQLFDRVVRRSGLPRIGFHDLRHTHASLLVAGGVPIKVVSERLGHAHPGFTMNTYQHVLPGMGERAAAQFAALLADDDDR
jgi:integrase